MADTRTGLGGMQEILRRLTALERRRPIPSDPNTYLPGRLGPVGKAVEDANLATQAGFYAASSATANIPVAAEGTLLVEFGAGTAFIQTYHRTGSSTGADIVRTWRRRGATATGAWTAWSEVAPTATESRTGLVELATLEEVASGTDTSRAVTPAGLFSSAMVSRSGTMQTSSDWNTFIEPGVYRIGGTPTGPNGPVGAYPFGTLMIARAGTSVTQIYYPDAGYPQSSPWIRTTWNLPTGWKNWSRLIPDDTLWAMPTLSTVTPMEGVAERALKVRRIGDIVHIRGWLDITAIPNGGNVNVATLGASFRPPIPVNLPILMWGATPTCRLFISEGGVVNILRAGSESSVNISATWMI